MNTARQTAMSIAIVFFTLTLAGQDETQPVSPVLDMVTVDPVTGFATLTWLPSVSPDVGSYVIYTYSGSTATAVDTVKSPYIYQYIHTGSAAKYHSVSYVVAAMDSSLNISPLSNSLSTIFLSAVNDTCNSRVLLSWTPYENSSHPAEDYRVMVARDGAPAEVFETIAPTVTSSVFTGYDPDTEYCFHVTASGNAGSTSASNRVCVISKKETAPGWVNIDAIMVTKANLSFTAGYDQVTDIDKFSVVKYNPVTSTWSVVATATGSGGEVSFTLPGADTAVVSLYAVTAVNNCGLSVISSNPAKNIVLASTLNGTRIDLRWNSPVVTGEMLYSVWRDKGDGWSEAVSFLSDTTWSDDYSLFVPGITAPSVAYVVTAGAPGLPAGAPLHRSSAVAVQIPENIFVPNAFTPAVPGPNEEFRPVLSFVPADYEFMIFSRSGVMLFRTTDYGEGWNGSHNGAGLPSGVYLWSMRLRTPSGGHVERTGTVTILP
jgi:gliding motility-associated-like protein